jgi:baculoviral IAP repeat-containing protein 7/8
MMTFEKFRVESYKKWPIPYIDVRKLASDGFYYTGYDDLVECRFCRLQLHRWEADDNISEQHLSYSPGCPFLRGIKTENIPLYKKNVSDTIC